MSLTLEIVEGPGAGQSLQVTQPIVIGREGDVDLALADDQASRRHARLTPRGGDDVVVEDLGSTNGTFVNREEVHGPTALAPGDELIVGVTVLQLRGAAEVARQPSAVRAVPPPLAALPRRPTYVDGAGEEGRADSGIPELERLRDRRTRAQAQLAPLTILILAALAVVIYLGATS
jgi:pSer/pThr/pTyr-binding forkhead associated (FHA) protein